MLLGQGLKLVIQALYFTVIARFLGAPKYGAFVGVVGLVGILYPFGPFFQAGRGANSFNGFNLFVTKSGYDADRPEGPRTMMICEVHEDLVPRVHHFLCQRDEFGRFTNWDPLFHYPWKTAEFPYGYAMVDGQQIHGFLGTIYARRTINGKSIPFCNISSWVVDESYRASLGKGGKGLGKRLAEPVLARKDVVVTALTPNVLSKKSCESMGFQRLDSEQVVIPVFPGFRGWSGFGSSRKLAISFKTCEIGARLTEKERKIFDDHRDLPCKHFLIDSPKTGEYCYGIATTGPIRRLAMVGGRVFNLCYVSNSEFFAEHFWSFAGLLWEEARIAAVRYDKRMIPQTVSTVSRPTVVSRLFHAADIGGPQVDLLYSELVLFNVY